MSSSLFAFMLLPTLGQAYDPETFWRKLEVIEVENQTMEEVEEKLRSLCLDEVITGTQRLVRAYHHEKIHLSARWEKPAAGVGTLPRLW